MQSNIDLSIIIVSWNVSSLLANAINSILHTAGGLKIEIIVIDNNSSDGTSNMLLTDYPDIRVIANKENVGFARANNQGLKIARGRYVLILNPDTEIVADALQRLIFSIDGNSNIGMVGPRLLNADQSIQHVCARRSCSLIGYFADGVRLTRVPVIGHWLRTKIKYPYDYSVTQPVEAISGAAMLVPRYLLQELSGFGETYLHTGEDYDLCYRIRQHGMQIWYVADAAVLHHEEKSSSQVPVAVYVNSLISVQQFFLLNHSYIHSIVYRIIITFSEIPMNLLISTIKLIMRRLSWREFGNRVQAAIRAWTWKAQTIK